MKNDQPPTPEAVESVTLTCVGCGKKIERTQPAGVSAIFTATKIICDVCSDKVEKKTEANRQERVNDERMRAWLEKCPPLFQHTTVGRLPKAMYSYVMNWKVGPTGLLLRGSTGEGKTRCMWELVRKLHFAGVETVCMTEMDLALEVNRQFGSHAWPKWVTKVTTANVLFVDNLGAAKLTDRVAEQMLHVFDTRIINERPILATTQLSGSEMADRFRSIRNDGALAEIGLALVRRLREFCDVYPPLPTAPSPKPQQQEM